MNGGEPGRPSTVRAILRSALAILLQHGLALALLGAALGVAPQIGFLQVGYILISDGGGAAEYPLPLRAVSGFALFVSAYLSVTALDVAVAAVALGREHRIGAVPWLVVRLLPVNLFCCVAGALAVGAAPQPLRGVVAAVFPAWSILLPIFVAERVRLRDLPRRGLALGRRRPGPALAIFACSFALTAAVAADPFGFESGYPLASAADLGRAVAWSGTAFAVQIASDAVFAALYLALRREEGGARDAALASAFD